MPLPPTGPASGAACVHHDLQDLSEACRALWLATLSLMTAFMQTTAPAHRHLLARRIAVNLRTLNAQPCFATEAKESFGRLAGRWERIAWEHHPEQPAGAGEGFLAALRRFTRNLG